MCVSFLTFGQMVGRLQIKGTRCCVHEWMWKTLHPPHTQREHQPYTWIWRNLGLIIGIYVARAAQKNHKKIAILIHTYTWSHFYTQRLGGILYLGRPQTQQCCCLLPYPVVKRLYNTWFSGGSPPAVECLEGVSEKPFLDRAASRQLACPFSG